MSSKDSKTNFALLRDKVLQQNGKEYWRSVEEFVDAPEFAEFVKNEYPAHAEEWDSALSRRNFIKVMGASLALAGLSGCVIQPSEKIVPYVSQPEDIIPGKPLFFATAMTLGGLATGLLAKSNEGRPTKIEGNPEHPQSLGATDVRAQASLLDMYDPDRSREVSFRGQPRTWQSLMTELRSAVDQNRVDGGAGIRFMTETVTSPTLIAQFDQLRRELPNAKWVQYEPINGDNATEGAKLAFGTPVHTIYKFDLADRVLTLDKDIFNDFNVRYTKDYIRRRKYEQGKELNRLYAIETTLTLTGAKADHRLAVKPSQMIEIAKAVAAAVGVGGATSAYTENAEWIGAMARDLAAHRGRSIVVAGENQPPVLHALAHAMNQALGNIGTTVILTDPLSPFAEVPQMAQLGQLIQDIDAGAVKMLVVLGGNPVYNTPIDLKLNAERMNKIPLRVHLGHYMDETGELCHWHVSEKHYLESWSDARAFDGTATLVQPLIQPLYDSRNAHEMLQLFFRENFEKKDYDIVREFWQTQNINLTAPAAPAAANNQTGAPPPAASPTPAPQVAVTPQPAPAQTPGAQTAGTQMPGAQTQTTQTAAAAAAGTRNFEDVWRKIVHDGLVPNTAARPKAVSFNGAFLGQMQTVQPVGGGALEISILPDPNIYDGRFNNNGWLQELPRPLTKVTWDNVALISPRTAQRLGLNQARDYNEMAGGEQGISFINTKGGNLFSDLVTLTMNGAQVGEGVPVWIQPGQPDDVVTIFLGYGRPRSGRVGSGLGYNAYDVRRSDAMWFGTGELAKRGEQAVIASTQTHFNMEERDLLRVWDLEEFNENPKMGLQHNEYEKSMYPYEEYQRQYEQHHRWGMAIDLNNCVGCNACVIACQSENNIPVVGKEQVERSREMHWLRIDTYFSGDVNNPNGPSFQPLPCQQCEQAPCEVVCPVHATVHSAEGLNDMVYNRCVGTRYCSNNCPYKVRRFNFLLYQDWNTPQYKLMRNPEVTVRSRGVMEKCTYCTQRIASARIEAEKDNRRVRDGEVLTACQSVCPADAIVFGDMNDRQSEVMQLKQDPRSYTLLNELNTQPRTTYLAGIKNQNKEMPDVQNLKPPREAQKTGTVQQQETGTESH